MVGWGMRDEGRRRFAMEQGKRRWFFCLREEEMVVLLNLQLYN